MKCKYLAKKEIANEINSEYCSMFMFDGIVPMANGSR